MKHIDKTLLPGGMTTNNDALKCPCSEIYGLHYDEMRNEYSFASSTTKDSIISLPANTAIPPPPANNRELLPVTSCKYGGAGGEGRTSKLSG